nr:DUF2460 domain-containing protein [uncultured Rhodopila sp.]
MAIPVFPTLIGQAYPLARSVIWKTSTQESWSGKETRTGAWTYPKYQWSAPFELLRSDLTYAELQTLLGFVNSLNGGLLPFYFSDPADNAVLNQGFGTGDGATTAFQLVRAFGGFAEPMQSINGTPLIYVNGVATTAFTLSNVGVVTFAAPPASGASITWSGSYYWLCKLDKDQTDFSMFMNGLWEAKQLSFTSIKL